MSEGQELDQSSMQGEVARLMELLRTIVRLLGYTNREVERRANFNHATAVRYFSGEGEPKVEFLLGVLRAIGLEEWEFFALAYPEREETSATYKKLQRLVAQLVPATPARPPQAAPAVPAEPEWKTEQMEREIRDMVEKALQKATAPEANKGVA
jgi:transcriptional regulator with XRE-family HTH domain